MTYLVDDENDLFSRLDSVLSNGKYRADARLAAKISMGFCELLGHKLDEAQVGGVEAARRFWAGDDTDYARWLDVFARRVDADQKRGEDSPEVSINRLVWSALNQSDGLSGYEGEFILELALGAGLTPRQLADVLSECIPAFSGK